MGGGIGGGEAGEVREEGLPGCWGVVGAGVEVVVRQELVEETEGVREEEDEEESEKEEGHGEDGGGG